MVYWLVFFSIVIHGLSVPILHLIYRLRKVPKVHDEHPIEIVLLSTNEPLPANSTANAQRHSAILNNRFSRQDENDNDDEEGPGDAECTSSSGANTAMQGIRRALTVQNPPQHHHNHTHSSSGSHHRSIFRRARSSFDRHQPNIYHNHTNSRHERTSLHGSDVIEILSHQQHQNGQSPVIKPQSLSDDSSRTSTDMGPSLSRREVPQDMI